MRIYTLPWSEGFNAVAPEVPGTWFYAESVDEAVAGCRKCVEAELEAYRKLGLPLTVSPGFTVLPSWQAGGPVVFAEDLIPPQREFVTTVVRRIEDVRGDLDSFLDQLAPDQWGWRRTGKWDIRTLLDHIANSQWLTLQMLDRWPLDPLEAQRESLLSLHAELSSLAPRDRVRSTEHFGLNQENGRVRWTAAKVLRVVLVQQEGWLAHIRAGAAKPKFPLGHEDHPEDQRAPRSADLDQLLTQGRELIDLTAGDPRTRGLLPIYYRYYRRRLVSWPLDPRERWEAIWQRSRHQFLTLSDEEISLVRVDPLGNHGTVRKALGLSLSHMRGHFGQMQATVAQLQAA